MLIKLILLSCAVGFVYPGEIYEAFISTKPPSSVGGSTQITVSLNWTSLPPNTAVGQLIYEYYINNHTYPEGNVHCKAQNLFCNDKSEVYLLSGYYNNITTQVSLYNDTTSNKTLIAYGYLNYLAPAAIKDILLFYDEYVSSGVKSAFNVKTVPDMSILGDLTFFWRFDNNRTLTVTNEPLIFYSFPKAKKNVKIFVEVKNSLSSRQNQTTITVQDPVSNATLASTANRATEDTVITFTIMDCCGTDVSYYWNFGDGSFEGDNKEKHLFSKPGLYLVNATVSNKISSIQVQSSISITNADAKTHSQNIIIGSVIGGFAFLVILAFLLYRFRRRRNNAERADFDFVRSPLLHSGSANTSSYSLQ